MQYREFGRTGLKISALGFGSMRLPMVGDNVDEEAAVAAMHRAFELGVNYIDSAYFYNRHQSEIVVGKALKGWRDKVMVSTKAPDQNITQEQWRATLDEQLKKLDLDGEPHRPRKILYVAFLRQPPYSFLVDITEQFERKLAAVRAYTSQFSTPEGARSIYEPGVDIFELMTVEARHLGRMIRKPSAEAYVIKEAIEIDDPMTMMVPSI